MSLKDCEHLQNCLNAIPQKDYPFQSRIHALQSFANENVKCYVKREDELGYGISGSKIRKYRTLIPHLLQSQIEEVVVIGSAFSNHVLGFSQLLIENQIKSTFFLRGRPHDQLQGNALLSSLFIPKNHIHWFSKENWKNVQIAAHAYADQQKHSVFILPEGGSSPTAFSGSLTLPLDILRNQQENGLHFSHIFIDSGTGLIASALILGLNWLQKETTIHTVLMAEDQSIFIKNLEKYHDLFNQLLNKRIDLPKNFQLYFPALKRFGKVNQTIIQFIAELAQSEGFLTDPIYSAKLFIEAKKIIATRNLQGNILIIHSGGAISLNGYLDQLKKSL